MKKLILSIIFVLSSSLHAGILDGIEDAMKGMRDVVKAPFDGDDEMPKVETVRTVRTIKGHGDNKEEESLIDGVLNTVTDPMGSKGGTSLITDMVDEVKETVGFKEEKPQKKKETTLYTNMVDGAKDIIGIKEDKPKKKSSFLDDTLTAAKEVVGMETVKEDNSIFDGGIMGSMADMIDLEKGESYGLPSVFGLNKKKKKEFMGSSVLGDTFLGDIQDSTSNMYRGFKTSGESTEFMSGIMYKSSKAYNDMFDVFNKGNSVLDIFDWSVRFSARWHGGNGSVACPFRIIL